MTSHEMSLNPIPFAAIQAGTQVIETRIYNEKRRLIEPGDTIIFYERPGREKHFSAEILGVSIFTSFVSLFSAINETKFGYDSGTTPDEMAENMRKYYTQKEEEQFGVMGIHLKLI